MSDRRSRELETYPKGRYSRVDRWFYNKDERTSHGKLEAQRTRCTRALEHDVNIGRGTWFRVKLLTRLLYRSTTNCQLTTQTDHEHGSALTPLLRTLPYSGSNISNS